MRGIEWHCRRMNSNCSSTVETRRRLYGPENCLVPAPHNTRDLRFQVMLIFSCPFHCISVCLLDAGVVVCLFVCVRKQVYSTRSSQQSVSPFVSCKLFLWFRVCVCFLHQCVCGFLFMISACVGAEVHCLYAVCGAINMIRVTKLVLVFPPITFFIFLTSPSLVLFSLLSIWQLHASVCASSGHPVHRYYTYDASMHCACARTCHITQAYTGTRTHT